MRQSKYKESFLDEIDFEPWRNCLGMFVIVRSQESMSPAEIVASCLWTMTCYGFSQKQINKKFKSWGLVTVHNGKVENYE
jgi:hypothetical protein